MDIGNALLIIERDSNMKALKGSKIFALIWLVIGLVGMLLFLGIARNYLDSDMASELMLARLCASEHNWLTTSWYYSTELRLCNMQIIMIPLFWFLSDFTTVRVISTAIIYFLTLWSYFYCCKQTGVLNKAIYFAPVFATPFSACYTQFDMIGLYYYVYTIVSFFSVGFMLKINNDEIAMKKKIAPWLWYIGLAVVIGLTTIRQLILLYYPMSLVLLILWINSYVKRNGLAVPSIRQIKENIILKWREDRYLKLFLTSCVGSVAASFCYIINVVVLRKIYSFNSYDRLMFTDVSDFKAVSEMLMSHITVMGYTPDVQFISVNGIANMCTIFFVGVMAYMVYRMLKRFPEYDYKCQVVIGYFVSALLFNDFIYTFSTLRGERYMLPYLLFFTVIFSIYMEKTQVHKSIKRLFYVIFCVVFLLNAAIQCKNLWEGEKDNGRNEVAQYLVDQGYDFGYATFWNANVFTELTNGKVEVRNVHIQNWETMEYEHWLMEKRNENRVEDKPIFILMDYVQYADNKELPFLQEKYRVYDRNGYMVFEYANTEELYSMVKVEEKK